MADTKKQQAWMTDLTPEAYEAVGRYVVMCSTIEVSTHAVLKRLLQIEDEIVRLVVKEARIGDLLEYLGFTARHRKLHADQLAALDLLRQDIVYLNDVRSFVAHKPVIHRDDDSLLFHNAMTAARVESVRGYICTKEQLKAGELYGIQVAGLLLELNLSGKADPAAYLTRIRELRAWREKLPLPANPKDRTPQSTARLALLQPSWPSAPQDTNQQP